MPEPEILACYRAPDGHVVDLWTIHAIAKFDWPPSSIPELVWCAGNDDRSVTVSGAPTADAALDAYLRALEIERQVMGDDDTDEDGPLDVVHDDLPPDGAAFRVGNMGAFRAACLRAAEGGELDLSGCDITPIPGDPS